MLLLVATESNKEIVGNLHTQYKLEDFLSIWSSPEKEAWHFNAMLIQSTLATCIYLGPERHKIQTSLLKTSFFSNVYREDMMLIYFSRTTHQQVSLE